MSATPDLPANVHVSNHPCLRAKLSLLRSKSTQARDAKALVNQISTIVGCEAFASALTAVDGPKDETPIGFEYTTTNVEPQELSLVPILRSGLGMVEAIQTLLPNPIPVHHLGLYREPSTLDPVEYYNNLPHHIATGNSGSSASRLAIILDPVIATGGTCVAAIQTLREWGVKRIVVLSVIAAVDGIRRAAAEWPDAVEIWVAGVDAELTKDGMLKPGVGDVGDRLFLTIGK
ncbi:uracil phosphoribosyltransferase [Pseudomassariella vexata]|uniref:uracil phosphoribosyltransferase n=1 Tax=Pseudomassariella vexata TaxID=1141098 RepID=A0A1Y2DIQ5_9PEZI|nr:uracil phosphoribosyltransferase [Pseudomassariella vexata]ORY59046.1 uracil phosphoribosyltransferase [Pseudomassariella vexata]